MSKLSDLRSRLLAKLDAREVAGKLFRTMLGTLGIRMFNNVLMFATAIIMARLLGAADYGAFSFGVASMQLLMVFVLFGARPLIQREVGQASAHDDGARVVGVLRFTFLVSLTLSGLFIVLFWLFRDRLTGMLSPELALGLSISLWATPVASFMNIYSYALRGIGKVINGLWGEFLTQPIVFVVLVVMAVIWSVPVSLSLEAVLWFNVVSWSAALIMLIWQWARLKPQWAKGVAARVQWREWPFLALNLLLIGFAVQIASRVDRVMLGWLSDASSVGVYTIASRLPEAAEQFVFALHAALGPMIARAYAEGEIGRMKQLIRTASRVTFAATVIVIAAMIIFAQPIFAFFGDDFGPGVAPFVVLGMTKIVVSFAGPAMLLLSMTNQSKQASVGIGLGAALNIALNFLFIPRWGALGAAWATLISTVGWNVYLAVFAYLKVGVNSCAIGPLGNRPVPPAPARLSKRDEGDAE